MSQPKDDGVQTYEQQQAEGRALAVVLDRIDKKQRLHWIAAALLVLVLAGTVLWLRLTVPPPLSVDVHTVFFFTGKLITGSTLMLASCIFIVFFALQIEIRRSTKILLRAVDETRRQRNS